ncbi:MAG: formylglycine-generating enzyme family protein, partial [Chitinophagia bacterium]|nr:formylglycine-generating enzyme family protein [Chitinophagia bacterium]
AKYITSGGKEYVEDARPGHHSPLAAVIMKELDDCYENAQPLSFSRLVSAVKSIKPTPRAGDFGASQPNSDFLLIPNSVAKGNGKKPKYNNPQQKTVITKNAPASEAADPYADLNDDKPHIPSVEELKPPMAFLKGGSFTMGAYRSDYHDEEPLHMVKLSGFYMSKYEVTQKLWTDVMGLNPSLHTGCPDCPVENISFQDIQKFIYKLNKRTKKNYRLPTEAEWEYAANCGNMDMAYEFSGSERIDWVGWYKTNSGGTTHSVGQKMANSLGIFDLTGNVAEWCQDTYASYAADTLVNPVATSGGNRVVRGGDYTSPVFKCRNAYRSDRIPNTKDGTVGFRLVLSGDIDPDAPVIPGN